MTEHEALVQIAAKQIEALALIETNDFVFTDIGTEKGNWQHLAFTLYCEICEIDTIARNALDWPPQERLHERASQHPPTEVKV